MTHRLFSRNSSSTRAIPTVKLADLALQELVEPIRWGFNQAGMQATEEDLTGEDLEKARAIWFLMAAVCAEGAKKLSELGLHKQWAGRALEWFSNIKVIISATEWDNFLTLRDHDSAQPEIQELAREIKKALAESNPTYLKYGEWHLPYITQEEKDNPFFTFPENTMLLPKVSAARCCRVSYLKHDGLPASIDEDLALCNKLIGATPKHFSPFEHVAQPWHTKDFITNFKGWKQYRRLLEYPNGDYPL
jgi:thymidylate synthase ThyX